MKKKPLILTVIVIVVLLCAAIGIAAVQDQNPLFHIGRLFQEKNASMGVDSNVAAVYHGQEISMETVEYYRKARSGSELQGSVSDREILDEIIRNIILTEEAEARGLGATEEEVDDAIELQKQWYDEYDTVREPVDSFCAGAGITVEEYFDILREQLPRQISRSKLVSQLNEEWCAQHNAAYDAANPSQEMREAVNRQLEELVAAHLEEVTYYIR